MRESLEDVVELFELAQNTVFKLMASVRRMILRPCPLANLRVRTRYPNSFAHLSTHQYSENTNSIWEATVAHSHPGLNALRAGQTPHGPRLKIIV